MGIVQPVIGPLATSGGRIINGDGRPLRLSGVNWGGAYQDHWVPSGLRERPRGEIIGWIAAQGFNSVRFPFAEGTFVTNAGQLKTAPADSSRLAANPDLAGATPWEIYGQLVDDMTAAGLYVVLNRHLAFAGWCCSEDDVNGFWYNDNWPSSTFTNTWLMLAGRFAANPMVGFDLTNEPRKAVIGGAVRTPAWGTGNSGAYPADFRVLYQATIDRIRAVTPGLEHLAFCEGLSFAGDLTGWRAHPVGRRNVVASAHDYPWFHRHADQSPQTQAEYNAQNDAKFGYLPEQGLAPLWIGECGSNTDAATADFSHGWFPNFLAWMRAHPEVGWCWWTVNATEQQGTEPGTNIVKVKDGGREGFGLLAGQDWRGSQSDTLALLASIM